MKNLERAKQLIDELSEAVKSNKTELWVDSLSYTLTSVVLEDVEPINDDSILYDASTWIRGNIDEAKEVADEWNEITGTEYFNVDSIPIITQDGEVYKIVGKVTASVINKTTISDEFVVDGWDDEYSEDNFNHSRTKIPQGNKFTGGNILEIIDELQTLLTWLAK